MTDYSIAANVAIASPPGEVMRWLTVPDLMVSWILGATNVDPLDGLGIASFPDAGCSPRLVRAEPDRPRSPTSL